MVTDTGHGFTDNNTGLILTITYVATPVSLQDILIHPALTELQLYGDGAPPSTPYPYTAVSEPLCSWASSTENKMDDGDKENVDSLFFFDDMFVYIIVCFC